MRLHWHAFANFDAAAGLTADGRAAAQASFAIDRTRWSVVFSAMDSQDPAGPGALEELCRLYWRPVYLFIRSRGNDPEESEDLTQEFFYRLLRGHYLKGIEGPHKGRFRSFLRVVLKRFMADEYDKRMSGKRGGKWKAIPIDSPGAEALLARERPENESPDLLFDRHWALDLLSQAHADLKREYLRAGKGELFDQLMPTISPHLECLPYVKLAAELDMTEGAVKAAVHRLRKRYRGCLNSILRETLEDPEDVAEELRYLLSLFTKS